MSQPYWSRDHICISYTKSDLCWKTCYALKGMHKCKYGVYSIFNMCTIFLRWYRKWLYIAINIAIQTRGVTRACGTWGKKQNGAPYFFVYIFLPKGLPIEKIGRRKSDTYILTKTVQIDKSWPCHWAYVFKRRITNLFLLGMLNGWSYIFYTWWHDFAPPGSGAQGQCPPLPA